MNLITPDEFLFMSHKVRIDICAKFIELIYTTIYDKRKEIPIFGMGKDTWIFIYLQLGDELSTKYEFNDYEKQYIKEHFKKIGWSNIDITKGGDARSVNLFF